VSPDDKMATDLQDGDIIVLSVTRNPIVSSFSSFLPLDF
jgi:hypothetical protein